jgi:isopentenyl diphosphate isomerase/L-lactate dehydrogenase-like FMN-dependent dehydrogenase
MCCAGQCSLFASQTVARSCTPTSRSLLAEFDILMNVAGFRSIKEIDRSALRYVGPAGAHL